MAISKNVGLEVNVQETLYLVIRIKDKAIIQGQVLRRKVKNIWK
jgi:hypothetical protein